MTFQEALNKLNIEDYAERIFNSNSHGELFHLAQYTELARIIEREGELHKFREWFERVVDSAKDWNRPESVFQHVLELFADAVGAV